MPGCFFCCFGRVSYLNPELVDLTNVASQLAPRCLVSVSRALGSQVDYHAYLVLTHRGWDPNGDSHTFKSINSSMNHLQRPLFLYHNFHKDYLLHEMSLSFCKNKNLKNMDLKTFKWCRKVHQFVSVVLLWQEAHGLGCLFVKQCGLIRFYKNVNR